MPGWTSTASFTLILAASLPRTLRVLVADTRATARRSRAMTRTPRTCTRTLPCIEIGANEAFLIGVLQVVSGGSLFAGLSQTEALERLAGSVSFLGFITLMAAALVASVLAAYWKHEYKKWDVKAAASVAEGNRAEAEARARKCRPTPPTYSAAATLRPVSRCPNWLSIGTWKGRDSNPRPRHYECRALTS